MLKSKTRIESDIYDHVTEYTLGESKKHKSSTFIKKIFHKKRPNRNYIHERKHDADTDQLFRSIKGKKKLDMIDSEKSLFIPLTRGDNDHVPWELVILRKKKSSIDTDQDNKETFIDTFLDTFDNTHNNPNNKETKLSDLGLIDTETERYEYVNVPSKNKSYYSNKEMKNHVQTTIVNAIFEKSLKKINTDVPKILNQGSFWTTSSISSQLSHSSNDRENKHKMKMINYIKSIIESNCTNKIKYLMQILDIGEKNDKSHCISEIGITSSLINHPFVLYCVGKKTTGNEDEINLQMYKLIITDIDYPRKINYKLYQIEKISDSLTRPMIISRDITDKFVSRSDPGYEIEGGITEDKKFVLGEKFSRIRISPTEIQNPSVLHHINDYANLWASLMNYIINDATHCIRAYINNPKKIKIDLNPMSVDLSVIKSIIQETEKPECQKLSITHIDDCTKYIEYLNKNNIHVDTIQFKDTNMYKLYHPFSKLFQELQHKKIIDQKTFETMYNCSYGYTKKPTGQYSAKCRILSNHILMKHTKYQMSMNDLTFVNDCTYDTYHFMENLVDKFVKTNKNMNVFVCNFTIQSNYLLKIYIRINDACRLIGEGKTIKFPILYESTIHNMYIKVDASLIETFKTNVLPYVKFSGDFLMTNLIESTIFQVYQGIMMDCVNNFGEPTEYVTTTAIINHEINPMERRIYFGQIKNTKHLEDIETELQITE